MVKKQKKKAERVTIGFVNFNNFKMVNECVESTVSQLGVSNIGPIFVSGSSPLPSFSFFVSSTHASR